MSLSVESCQIPTTCLLPSYGAALRFRTFRFKSLSVPFNLPYFYLSYQPFIWPLCLLLCLVGRVHEMTFTILALLVLSLLVYYYSQSKSSRRCPLPPGPEKLPIVENLFHIPNGGFIWLEYAQMCRKYGKHVPIHIV